MSGRPAFQTTLSAAFTRRLAKTPLRRRTSYHLHSTPSLLTTSTPIRSFASSSSRLLKNTDEPIPKRRHPSTILPTRPPDSALAALLSRLRLRADPSLYQAALSCLTHPSYKPPSTPNYQTVDGQPIDPIDPSTSHTYPEPPESNELLSVLGNSLLGLFASEHLANRFPLLPTEALTSAVTAYVGPSACMSVARELGIGVRGGGDSFGDSGLGMGRGSVSAGVPIRWNRDQVEGGSGDEARRIPIARRFRKFKDGGLSQGLAVSEKRDESALEGLGGAEDGEGGSDRLVSVHSRRETFEDIVASALKAFIGLIYQENGIHAARQFVHGHFFSRHLDLVSLFNFRNPKYVLSSVVSRHLAESGIPPASGAGRIESRLLTSTGTHSMSPLFNVGLFLPSGLKLAEGHGSSKAMAEHRAAVNALLSFYLVRGDKDDLTPAPESRTLSNSNSLPSSISAKFPIDQNGLVGGENESSFRGSGFGGLESVVESSRSSQRGGRVSSARRTNAL